MSEIHIPPLAPDVLFQLSGFVITNTMINVWLTILLFFVLGLFLHSRLRLRPGRFQNGCEFILEILFSYFDQVTGSREKTMQYFPLVGSTFFFILASNWLGLLPGTGSITLGQTFLFRPANTDLNLTVAMAVVSVVVSHLFGFFSVGFFVHLGKFIQLPGLIRSLKKGPIAIFTALVEILVGLIETIGELAKVLSLSLRLFGNMFAGEVLISVISVLSGIIIPTPFMILELLVGLIQAGVFAMLTLVYLTVATTKPQTAEH